MSGKWAQVRGENVVQLGLRRLWGALSATVELARRCASALRGRRLPRAPDPGPRGEHPGRSDVEQPRYWCPRCQEEFALDDLAAAFPFQAVPVLAAIVHAPCGAVKLRRLAPPDPAEGSLDELC